MYMDIKALFTRVYLNVHRCRGHVCLHRCSMYSVSACSQFQSCVFEQWLHGHSCYSQSDNFWVRVCISEHRQYEFGDTDPHKCETESNGYVHTAVAPNKYDRNCQHADTWNICASLVGKNFHSHWITLKYSLVNKVLAAPVCWCIKSPALSGSWQATCSMHSQQYKRIVAPGCTQVNADGFCITIYLRMCILCFSPIMKVAVRKPSAFIWMWLFIPIHYFQLYEACEAPAAQKIFYILAHRNSCVPTCMTLKLLLQITIPHRPAYKIK